MANWQRTLDIAEIWKQAKDLRPQDVAREIAQRLQALRPFKEPHAWVNDGMDELVEQFKDFADDDAKLDFDDFDDLMVCLYDWADQSLDNGPSRKKVCWVKTF